MKRISFIQFAVIMIIIVIIMMIIISIIPKPADAARFKEVAGLTWTPPPLAPVVDEIDEIINQSPIHGWRAGESLGVRNVPGVGNREHFPVKNGQWEFTAYCQNENLPVPPAGSIGSRNGRTLWFGDDLQTLFIISVVTIPDTPTPTPSPTLTPTPSPSATASPTATATSTATLTPTPTATATSTDTATNTATITPTATKKPTITPFLPGAGDDPVVVEASNKASSDLEMRLTQEALAALNQEQEDQDKDSVLITRATIIFMLFILVGGTLICFLYAHSKHAWRV